MYNLTSYEDITIANCVLWEVPGQTAIAVTDYTPERIWSDDTVFENIGNLLQVTSIPSELQASSGTITVSLSGIPFSDIQDTLTNEIKGSDITIYRAFMRPYQQDITNNTALVASSNDTPLYPDNSYLIKLDGSTTDYDANPAKIFKGVVTNFSVGDDIDRIQNVSSATITLTCTSNVDILSRKYNGRRTNPVDFPVSLAVPGQASLSMNNVQALVNSNYQFGAPK